GWGGGGGRGEVGPQGGARHQDDRREGSRRIGQALGPSPYFGGRHHATGSPTPADAPRRLSAPAPRAGGKKVTHRLGNTTRSSSGPIERPPTTTVARGRCT